MKRIKRYYEKINLNPKTEAISLILLILIAIISCIVLCLTGNVKAGLLAGSVIILFTFLLKLISYSKAKDALIGQHEAEFVTLINYLEIFISNKFNVYNAFQSSKIYVSNWMRDNIDKLLTSIDKDKSVAPYIEFSKNFKKPIVENVMISIYQLVEEGDAANQLERFDALFQSFQEHSNQAKIDAHAQSIESLATYPLIAAGLITLILTYCIMEYMGEMINVI